MIWDVYEDEVGIDEDNGDMVYVCLEHVMKIVNDVFNEVIINKDKGCASNETYGNDRENEEERPKG